MALVWCSRTVALVCGKAVALDRGCRAVALVSGDRAVSQGVNLLSCGGRAGREYGGWAVFQRDSVAIVSHDVVFLF